MSISPREETAYSPVGVRGAQRRQELPYVCLVSLENVVENVRVQNGGELNARASPHTKRALVCNSPFMLAGFAAAATPSIARVPVSLCMVGVGELVRRGG